MWSRRSSTRTRLSSSLATRSATVRPKNPEPTTMRSGLASVTPCDCTVAAPSSPDRNGRAARTETKPSLTCLTRRGGTRRPHRVLGVTGPNATVPLRIVAVTYSPGPALEGFIRTLASATARPVEVVLADNGSTDGVPEAVAAEHPHVRVLHTGGNVGYGAAVNAGLAGLTE